MDTDAGVVASRLPSKTSPVDGRGQGSKILLTQKAQETQKERNRWKLKNRVFAQRRGGGRFGFLEGPASTRAGIGIGTRTPWKAFLQKAEMRNSDP